MPVFLFLVGVLSCCCCCCCCCCRVWASEELEDSDWEDDNSMDSGKEAVDVDKVILPIKSFIFCG